MGRRTHEQILRIRYRKPGKVFGTKFVLSQKTRGKVFKINGTVVSVRKFSLAELNRVGEFNPLPEKLMREFQAQGA